MVGFGWAILFGLQAQIIQHVDACEPASDIQLYPGSAKHGFMIHDRSLELNFQDFEFRNVCQLSIAWHG